MMGHRSRMHAVPHGMQVDAMSCHERHVNHVECPQDGCVMGAACRNQRLRRRMWSAVEVRGEHIVASDHIPQRSLVAEAFGEILEGSLDFASALYKAGIPWPPELCFLTLGRGKSYALDVSRAGSLARMVTHSHTPNCEFQVWQVDGMPRLGVFTVVDISEGDVLTADYGLCAVGQVSKVVPQWW